MISPRYEQTFWVAALDDAFTLSAATAAARRNELEQHLIDLHKLRNRLAHHEPIFKPQTRRIGHTTRSVTLADQLSNILSVLDAIDPHISSQRQADTAVTELLQSRP